MRLFLFIIVSVLFFDCNFSDTDTAWKKNLRISNVMRLPSPDRRKSLYTYYLKNPDAHSGFTWMTIINDSSTFDPFAEHFSFEPTTGFNISGWSGDTLKINCILTDQQPKDLLSFKREIKKWQHWYLDISYYYANAFFATQSDFFDSCKIEKDTITFFGKRMVLGKQESYTLTASKGQVQVPLGDSVVSVNKLETKKRATDDLQISVESYELKPRKKVDWVALKESGVFMQQDIK